MAFSAKWFFDLDFRLRELGLDSDAQTFDEIKQNLSCHKKFTPDEFASQVIYVILAGGFSQKTAKKIHEKIMNFIVDNTFNYNDLLTIFNNKNKVKAICEVWQNRQCFCSGYYELDDLESKINYLQRLPHIGKITANHLARNLGEDIVKYDIWIQRLGVLYSGNNSLSEKINNGKLSSEVKHVCDDMFSHLAKETGLPRGYIDVVLWKACQNGLIKL